MESVTFDKVTYIHGDCMDYLRSLPDNAFNLAVCDPPFGNALTEGEHRNQRGRFSRYNSVSRTGGTWASKYGTNIKEWDVAPHAQYFAELFRVSENQIIWGGQLFWSATYAVLPCMAQAVNLRKLYYGNGGICVDFFQH